ncbi:metal-dependent hydrolase [Jiella sonneratiae]|uniref:UPF0173 metal-dependent hydrolase J1C47_03710 n=1 Tax=Jiella sonneratiae TaxID=2816856 RepID=A0ABS3IZA1_9HYPH|nr:metal-dependent hydrolase [Jiella sonneratiae]MBO0902733.1 metal-dependent hydrolase [Jiella sonneratiae]
MKITYLGHSAFRIDTGSSVILVDPFLTGNPHFEGNSVDAATSGVTHVVLSHGHFDHVGDTVDIARKSGCKVVGNFELVSWLNKQGVEAIEPLNTGGTAAFGDFSVTLTQAFHSSGSVEENGTVTYLGMPNGLVFHFDSGPTVYHMGDTDIFGDMALIEELHHPKIAMVPVGDRLTMGAAVAALACRRYFAFDKIVPIHWGTLPILDPNPEKFREAMEGDAGKVLTPKVGEPFEV